MALGDLKHDAIKFDVKGDIRRVAARLQDICDNLNAKTERFTGEDTFGVNGLPEIAVIATGKSILYGKWGVQIEVYSKRGKCLVVLGAMGDSFATKATAAIAGNNRLLAETYSLAGSKKNRDKIAKALGL